MSGHVVYRPSGEHECNPGATYRPWPEDSEIPPPFEGARLVDNPEVRDYPRGTVWQCDCGDTWVSHGPDAPPVGWTYGPGSAPVHWRRESRRARRKRERQGITPEPAFGRKVDVPGGMLTVPWTVTDQQADRLRAAFNRNQWVPMRPGDNATGEPEPVYPPTNGGGDGS